MTGRCLTDEDIAAFSEGRLPLPERDAAIAHCVDCPPCRELLSLAVEALDLEAGDDAGEGASE